VRAVAENGKAIGEMVGLPSFVYLHDCAYFIVMESNEHGGAKAKRCGRVCSRR
jgi:hypothetical protein